MPRRSRHRLNFFIKSAIAHALYAIGVLQLWQRYKMRHRTVVLMYHRVLNEDERRATGSHPGMCVSTQTFERQMDVVRRRFVPLTLEEFAANLRQKQPLPGSSCLITFDDGWQDTMTNAIPVLQRQQLPGVIFLPVNFIGSRRQFTREAFAHLVILARERDQREPQADAPYRGLLASAGLERLLDAADANPRAAVIESLGELPVDASVEELVADLSRALGVSLEDLHTPDNFMRWSDVEGLASQDVAFGGHGADHRQLARISPDQVEYEVRKSREVIAAHTSPPVWAFSYPNGSCNPSVAASVQKHGYEMAFTTRAGLVDCDDDPMFLPRVNIHEDMTQSVPMFLARVVGLF